MSRRAFTLIEVLLATALTAVVGLAVASVLSTQLTARTRMRARGDQRALLGAIERRLRSDLEGLVPPGGLYAAGVVGEDQVGTSGEDLLGEQLRALAASETTPSGEPLPIDQRDKLTLAVWPPAPAFGSEPLEGEGALWQVIYRIDDDPETPERGLVREVARVRDLAAGTDPPLPEEIAPEVVALQISYFDGEDWQATWDSGSSDTLPTSIAIELVLAKEPSERERGSVLRYRIEVSSLTARPSQIPEATE